MASIISDSFKYRDLIRNPDERDVLCIAGSGRTHGPDGPGPLLRMELLVNPYEAMGSGIGQVRASRKVSK